jgi:hypothetical protein
MTRIKYFNDLYGEIKHTYFFALNGDIYFNSLGHYIIKYDDFLDNSMYIDEKLKILKRNIKQLIKNKVNNKKINYIGEENMRKKVQKLWIDKK